MFKMDCHYNGTKAKAGSPISIIIQVKKDGSILAMVVAVEVDKSYTLDIF